MTNTISILGSTGSIGRQTLDVVDQLGVRVAALTCGTNLELMATQCRKYRPRLAVMANRELADRLRQTLQAPEIEICYGKAGLLRAAALEEADLVVVGDVHHPAQRGLGLGDDGIEPLAAVAHLHHALAAAAVFKQFGLGLLQDLFGQHAGACAEIVNSCHNATLPFLIPRRLNLRRHCALVLSVV